MKKLLFSVVVFCFFASVAYAGTVGPRQGREMSPYPEYSGVFEKSDIPYFKPNFGGKKHYWVRYWNASGYYEKDGKVYWDGVSYDGHLLYNPRIVFDKKENEYRFYFIDENFAGKKDPMGRPAERFFYGYQVVDDPRLTNWWTGFAGDYKAKNLSEAIENGAMTKKHSEITGAILKNMIESGVVKMSDLKNLKPHQIKKAINDYTNIALTYNLDQTKKIVNSGRKMNRERFLGLRKGDVIQDYYWDRFGPFPLVSHEAHVVKVNNIYVAGEKELKKTITARPRNRKETRNISWGDIADICVYMNVIKAKDSPTNLD